jgi:hypothetical protein
MIAPTTRILRTPPVVLLSAATSCASLRSTRRNTAGRDLHRAVADLAMITRRSRLLRGVPLYRTKTSARVAMKKATET